MTLSDLIICSCSIAAVLIERCGEWYEIQKLLTTFQKGECGAATYSLSSPGVIRVLNKQVCLNVFLYKMCCLNSSILSLCP